MKRMIYPDSDIARALGRHRQDEYAHEADVERLVRPIVERRRRRTTVWLLLHLRSLSGWWQGIR